MNSILGRLRRFCPTFLLSLSCTGIARGQPAPSEHKPVLFYIPHTHWEGAVFKTREGYLADGLPHILQALRLLKEFRDYKFTLDQVAYIRPFLERYPEEEANFRKFIAEGRLEIVGGMDVMPDDVKPGGELFIRQMQYGKQYCREKLGIDVTVGWFLDSFGHHPQMPQLLNLAGYKSFWFCRGVPHHRLPSEFHWQGIDGSEIPAFWLPGFYGLFYGPPRTLPAFAKFFQQRFDSLTPYARGEERVGLAGVDVCQPEEGIMPLVAEFNRQPTAPFKVHCAIPSEFEAVVAQRPIPPVIPGDFNPIFQGTYSSRIELKQRTRLLEDRLLTAEKLSALANWLGHPPDNASLWRAWEPVLFNQTHDLASGVMTDIVYDDTVRSYDFSERLADEILDRRWHQIADQVDTASEGIPIIVFNPLGWTRTDAAQIQIGSTEPNARSIALHDAAGEAMPVQIVAAERYHDGALKVISIAFLARSVPPLGYSVYHLKFLNQERLSNETHSKAGSNTLENDQYRATFNLQTGELTSLFDKSAQWEVLRGPGNIVARQQDKGDLWELYRGLDGASHIAMTNRQPVPRIGQANFSNESAGTNGVIRHGIVFSEFETSHAFTNGFFGTKVRFYSGLGRVEFETQLVNREKWVRYQALFPTSIRRGQNIQEIPFGAVERPLGIEFPAQHWIDYSDGHAGIALLNIGLPGNLVTPDGTLIVSLMRSHNLGAYGYGGGYEPGMSSETGFELGKRLTFRYALVPHRGRWNDAGVYRDGMEFNHPLLVCKVTSHHGLLPKRWSLLQISASNVVLSAVSPSRDGNLIVRCYEAGGRAAPKSILKLQPKIVSAQEINLMEDPIRPLPLENNSIQMDFRAFEIKTIQLRLEPANEGN